MTLNLVRTSGGSELEPRITVFGVGGAGGNAVNNMIDKALDGVDFVVGNTDAQALKGSRAPQKVQFGAGVTEGLGAGAKPHVGASAANESIEQIIDHLTGAHMCFITAGMGGGTGTGAAPVVAQAARDLGVLTVGVVTKPFDFEGGRRMRQAEAGIEELQKVVDTLIIIPNQNLFRLASMKTSIREAFMMADDVLYLGVRGVTDLMIKPGLMNLDFADVRSVMEEMGKAMMGTGEATTEEFPEGRAKAAAQAAIANPLLDEVSLSSAKGVLINVMGGLDMTLFDLDEATNTIKSCVDADANILVGSAIDEEMEGRIRVSVVATGIDAGEHERAEPAGRDGLPEPAEPAGRGAEARDGGEPSERGAPREAPSRAARIDVAMAAEAPAPFAHAPPQPRGGVRGGPPAAEGEDGLPPPVYSADSDSAPKAARRSEEERDSYADARLGAEPGRFVAPRPPGPRAQTATIRPGRPVGGAPQRPPLPAASEGAVERGRRSIDGLIGRMTGRHAAQEPDPRFATAPRGSAPAEPTRATDPDEGEAEPSRIAVPAFLRRQAN